jgi:hypothetical protein
LGFFCSSLFWGISFFGLRHFFWGLSTGLFKRINLIYNLDYQLFELVQTFIYVYKRLNTTSGEEVLQLCLNERSKQPVGPPSSRLKRASKQCKPN